jgi:predicted kinase
MEAILFCGIQATGKTSFFKDRFLKTHVRISMDLLKTRYREQQFVDTCLRTQMSFVVDNTNPSREERKSYIDKAKAHRFIVTGYYFRSQIDEALKRNALRQGSENVPEKGVLGTYKRLELPHYSEGFDKLFFVEIIDSTFHIKEWNNEI